MFIYIYIPINIHVHPCFLSGFFRLNQPSRASLGYPYPPGLIAKATDIAEAPWRAIGLVLSPFALLGGYENLFCVNTTGWAPPVM